jgi:protease YdgD
LSAQPAAGPQPWRDSGFAGDSQALKQQLQGIHNTVTNGGYPLDDLTHLLVHNNCQATGLLADGRLTHRCDTLEGNSGSPILAASMAA